MIDGKATASLPLLDDGMCFGCGPENAIGLRLTFGWKGDICETRWTPGRPYQGWAGRVHGGLLAVVLDETMSRAALERHGLHWVTAELTTRLLRPAAVGKELIVRARIETVRRSLIVCVGEVVDAETGVPVATGQAKMMRVRQEA